LKTGFPSHGLLPAGLLSFSNLVVHALIVFAGRAIIKIAAVLELHMPARIHKHGLAVFASLSGSIIQTVSQKPPTGFGLQIIPGSFL
jgi:hypothetical protein